MAREQHIRDVWRLARLSAAVAIAYLGSAKLGFQFAFVAEQVTTVWAPTGIALASLLLWGLGLAPAIWAGAFLANVGAAVPLWAAAGIATGNTLEAIAAVWVFRRLRGFDPAVRRISDTVAFIVVAALLATAISATVGTAMLCAAGAQPWDLFSTLWLDWWLGDALGAVVIAPAILTMARRPASWSGRDWWETGALVIGAAVATQLVFGEALDPILGYHPFEYITFCFVIGAAVRLGQPATALVVVAASAVTIGNTARGTGPFAAGAVHESLILLQAFMGVLAGTGLLLAAAIAERKTSERRRAAAYAVGEVLADAPNLSEAAPAILRAICTALEWQVSALWLVDDAVQRLRCVSVWSCDGERARAFVAATQETQFPSGVGLPGRVWKAGKAAWIEDVVRDTNFPRAPAASAVGVHGAFAFPICLGKETLGVIECFTRSVAAPDMDLLRTMSTVGNQIGQFIGRKRVEGAVDEGQRRTAAILNTALDAIIGMDHHGIITEFNPAAERIFGYARENAVGRDLADLLIPSHLREPHRSGLARFLATGQGPFIDRRVETIACHADGRQFPVEVSITRVPDADPPRFTGFVRDLTDRAKAERERELLLYRESAARREAETANRAKDDFLATLSHELRTPLNAIVGWTRMLLDGTLDERSTARALQVIDRNAHLQVQLVSDILDVSRIITGGLKLDVQPVDLVAVIGAALDAVRPAADAKQIQIRTHLGDSARFTEGDPQRLQQVVWNLLANAVKFTEAGGRIDVELLERDRDAVAIRVTDNGIGIDPAFLPHVFDRFSQADGSVSRQHGGLGLGLAIVRHLAELHGGTVRAESEGVGHGATFMVSLPRMKSDAAALTGRELHTGDTERRQRAATLTGCRVFVVDDDEDARELSAKILMNAGADVRTASSAEDALEQLAAWVPDVLLADLGMPGADGFALIREVRRREAHGQPHLPAVAVTAYAGDHDRTRALAAGFDRHVPKPIDPTSLVETVRSLQSSPTRRSELR